MILGWEDDDTVVSEIECFLRDVRRAIDDGNKMILGSRTKFRSTIAQLGITIDDVWDDIYNLSAADSWIKTADDNPNFPGYVWITKKTLHGACIYIKLKIKSDPMGQLLVMSYHIDETW